MKLNLHKARLAFPTIEALVKSIPAKYGGYIREGSEGLVYWYSSAYGPGDIAQDLKGEHTLSFRMQVK